MGQKCVGGNNMSHVECEGPLLVDNCRPLIFSRPAHPFPSAGQASALAKQIMRIQQPVSNLRAFLQSAAYRSLDGLAGFAA